MPARHTLCPWSADDEARLRALVADQRTAPFIATAMGRTIPSVNRKLDALGLRGARRRGLDPFTRAGADAPRLVLADASPEGPVEVYAPSVTADETDAEFLARVLHRTTRSVAVARAERHATVRIASDLPIALSLSSDWHLDAVGATDVAGLHDYTGTVSGTPGAYAAVIGDVLDNPIKHRGAQGVTAVPDELRLADLLLGRLGRKLLWMTSGNHDDWSKAFAGVDHLRAIASRRRIHYAPDELVVVVEIVDPADAEVVTARWVVATRHQYRRHSALNDTHSCWRWLEEMVNDWPTDADGRTLLPDVLAIGHNHVAAVETRSTERGDVVACRMGAWQDRTPYSRALGFKGSRPTAPTVILHPTRTARPEAYADYRVAFDRLRALRSPAPVTAAA